MMEKIRNLIREGKLFDAGGWLAAFIRETSATGVRDVAPELKGWLLNDLVSISLRGGERLNESLWVLQQGGVADRLREAGILPEIAEPLLKEAIRRGNTYEVAQLKEFTGRDLSDGEVLELLSAHAGSYQYCFSAELINQLPPAARMEIAEKVVRRAVSLGWWDAVESLMRGLSPEKSLDRKGIEGEVVQHILENLPNAHSLQR